MVVLISNSPPLLNDGADGSNDAGLVQGQLDIPLNNHGRKQIEKLAKHCELVPFNRIYTSNLSRAIEVRLTPLYLVEEIWERRGKGNLWVERRDHCETPGTRRSCHKSRAEGSTLRILRRGALG